MSDHISEEENSETPERSYIPYQDQLDYDALANEFLKQKIENMYAAANNSPIPSAKATDYLQKQIDSFDAEIYKDRRWNQYEFEEDFSDIKLNLD